MYAVYGSALIAAAISAIALLVLWFGTPSLPLSLRSELAAQLAGVMVTIMLGFGLGLLALSLGQMRAEGVTLIEVAAFAGGLALVWLVPRALKVGPRLRANQAAALAGVTQPPAP